MSGRRDFAVTLLVVLWGLSLGLWGGQGEGNVIDVDRLLAGGAAAGPALEERLQEQDRLRECQAGRWRFGCWRSRVRKPCAAVTSAVW